MGGWHVSCLVMLPLRFSVVHWDFDGWLVISHWNGCLLISIGWMFVVFFFCCDIVHEEFDRMIP